MQARVGIFYKKVLWTLLCKKIIVPLHAYFGQKCIINK